MTKLLEKLGFLRRSDPTQRAIKLVNKEPKDKQVWTMWKTLGGEELGHVTLNNLRMMLFAVKGVKVSPDVKVDYNMSFKSYGPVGYFSAAGDLYLSEVDVQKSIKLFAQMARIHLLFEQDLLQQQKEDRQKAPVSDFKPSICQKSAKLAERKRSKSGEQLLAKAMADKIQAQVKAENASRTRNEGNPHSAEKPKWFLENTQSTLQKKSISKQKSKADISYDK